MTGSDGRVMVRWNYPQRGSRGCFVKLRDFRIQARILHPLTTCVTASFGFAAESRNKGISFGKPHERHRCAPHTEVDFLAFVIVAVPIDIPRFLLLFLSIGARRGEGRSHIGRLVCHCRLLHNTSPMKKSIRATSGPCDRNTALRSLPESRDSRRSRALSSATMARPRLQSDFFNGLLSEKRARSGDRHGIKERDCELRAKCQRLQTSEGLDRIIVSRPYPMDSSQTPALRPLSP